jgi:hypothetical protein
LPDIAETLCPVAMKEPAWRKLAEELKRKGIENPHAARLEARVQAITGVGSIEAEILSEMATSLRRAEDKILAILLELDVLDARIREAQGTGLAAEASAATERFNRRRDDALEAVRDLAIQRESIGFRNNDDLRTLYSIPPRRT